MFYNSFRNLSLVTVIEVSGRGLNLECYRRFSERQMKHLSRIKNDPKGYSLSFSSKVSMPQSFTP